MIFDSYIVSDTKTSLSMSLLGSQTCPPPRKLKHSKGFERFAFTLAETLITLTIIGVVAALTIPTLMNKYNKHTYVVGLKKAYSQLQNAMKMIPITEGCSAGDYDCAGMFQGFQYINGQYIDIPVTNIDEMDFGGDKYKKQMYLLSKQFKTSKFCITDQEDGCSFLRKGLGSDIRGGFITTDGIEYFYVDWGPYVDVNGAKGPNKVGRDIFQFIIADKDINSVHQGTVIPVGSKLDQLYGNNRYWKDNNLCTTESVADYDLQCPGRVLEEDAMNY